jgi:hypothetical protein
MTETTTTSTIKPAADYEKFSLLMNKSLADFMTSLVGFTDRYKKFEPEIRFMLLTDKLRILFKVLQGITAVSIAEDDCRIMNDKNKTEERKLEDVSRQNILSDTFNKVFDSVQNEIEALENFVQGTTKTNKMLEQQIEMLEQLHLDENTTSKQKTKTWKVSENESLKPTGMSQNQWIRMIAEEEAIMQA